MHNKFIPRFLDWLTWPRIVLLSLGGALLVGAWVYLMVPREYTARASLLTNDEPDPIKMLSLSNVSTPSTGGALALLGGGQDPLRRMELVLRSRTVQQQLVETFQLDQRLGLTLPEAIRSLNSNTSIRMQGGGALVANSPGMVIEVTWGSNSRLADLLQRPATDSVAEAKQLSADLTNAYLDILDEYMTNNSVRSARETREFIEKRQAEVETQVTRTENRLQQLQRQYGLMDLESKTGEVLERTASLTKARGETAAQTAALQDSLNKARAQLPLQQTRRVSTAVTQRNPLIVQLETQAAQLQVRLDSELANGKSLKHPDVAEIRSQIASAQQQLKQLTEEVRQQFVEEINPVHDLLLTKLTGLEVDLAGARARLAVLDRELGKAQANLTNLPPVAREYAHLRRQLDIQAELMGTLMKRLEIATIEEQRESSGRIQVLDRAIPPDKKSRPSTVRTLGATFVLLLMVLTLGWVYRRGWLLESLTQAATNSTDNAVS